MLKNQLKNYKKIITQRSNSTLPVVTYQDNMQMSRTSLRHLRLSKLQKEKMRQEKMWDFTVRGWRVADVTGMESTFDEVEAVKPQREVKKLEYEDTKISKFCVLNSLTERINFTSQLVRLGLG